MILKGSAGTLEKQRSCLGFGLEKSRNGSEFLVSVSSRSRKIILENSRSRLGLEILTKPGLGLVSVSKNVVSSNSASWDVNF